MVTGASTADVAMILLDARRGVVEQTRRHAYIAAILGIPHVVVAVNKMDLVDFSQERFARDRVGAAASSPSRLGVPDLRAIPISALHGDNVVERGEAMPWYDGARCSSISRRSRSPATATSTTAASRCSG